MRVYLLLLVCPLLSGCLGFGYPSSTRTPELNVGSTDVRAFRVTSITKRGWGPLIAGAFSLARNVEEIPVRDTRVCQQRHSYFAYCCWSFLFAGSNSQTLEVLLYKQGYEVVVVPERASWKLALVVVGESVTWKEAPDLASQKAAVDRIVPERYREFLGRDVLRFAASEYAQLANSPLASAPGMEATRLELLALSKECDDLAATKLAE